MIPGLKQLFLHRRITRGFLILWALLSLTFVINPQQAVADFTPTLQFSTYLGGSSSETGQTIAVDQDGNIYVTGSTSSPNFPATNPLGVGTSQSYMYLTKFDPTGTTQLYSIFLGSGISYDIAVDSSGYAYVVGTTTNIPTVNPIQAALVGFEDAFIMKVNPSGTGLVYSTYLGGASNEEALGIGLDANHNVYVVGATSSPNFPTHNAIQNNHAGGEWDIFIVRLNADGTALDYSTYYGGNKRDVALDVVVDEVGNVYITGETTSDNFPTMNAFQPEISTTCGSITYNCSDAVVAKFSPNGLPIYSTYLGGNANPDVGDGAYGIAIDSDGSAYVTGYTGSSDFPITPDAYQTSVGYGSASAFVTKFSPDGSDLVYSSYLGGTTGGNLGVNINLDSKNNMYVSGSTSAPDFPVAHPIQGTRGGSASNIDAFITVFRSDGQDLLFSTYLGGSKDEYYQFNPRAVVDSKGNFYITGTTFSSDFPVLNAFQSSPGGPTTPSNMDAFVAKIGFPLLSLPDDAPGDAVFTTQTPTLTWNAVTWAQGYHIQVDRTATFNAPYDFEAETSAEARSIPTTELGEGKYYWRVQAKKLNGEWGAWSPIETFVIYTD
jgi:hypothetical protein